VWPGVALGLIIVAVVIGALLANSVTPHH